MILMNLLMSPLSGGRGREREGGREREREGERMRERERGREREGEGGERERVESHTCNAKERNRKFVQ